MPKKFYTETDIEDLFKQGVASLKLGDDTVLTQLAYEKAQRLGLQLVSDTPDSLLSAPVRPYLVQKEGLKPNPKTVIPPLAAPAGDGLSERIRQAVVSGMGSQVEPKLLERIIERVLSSTGMK